MKFRPHRGMLADAMKECVDVDGIDGLMAHLEKIHPPYYPDKFDPGTVTIKSYGSMGRDDRIGWTDLRIVSDHIGVIGFIGESSLPASPSASEKENPQ